MMMGKVIEPLFFSAIAFYRIIPLTDIIRKHALSFIIINLLLLLTCYHRIHRALKTTMTDE